ncbi:MAG: AAA family ATPase [Acidimicrobiales bacterium]
MVLLVLLNGPPASGKSTIAGRFTDSRPLALNLDVDVVRGMLGAWLDDPSTAGLAARSLALAMAETHLTAGRDVIVPQFLGRRDFLDQLAEVAERTQATFIETALWLDRETALAAFAQRGAMPSDQTHHDAVSLVDRAEHADPVGRMYDAFVELVETRPATRRVDVIRGEIDLTFARFVEALDIRAC